MQYRITLFHGHILLTIYGSHLTIDAEKGGSIGAVNMCGVDLLGGDVEIVEGRRCFAHVAVGGAEHIVSPHQKIAVGGGWQAIPTVVVVDKSEGCRVAGKGNIASVLFLQSLQLCKHAVTICASAQHRQAHEYQKRQLFHIHLICLPRARKLIKVRRSGCRT